MGKYHEGLPQPGLILIYEPIQKPHIPRPRLSAGYGMGGIDEVTVTGDFADYKFTYHNAPVTRDHEGEYWIDLRRCLVTWEEGDGQSSDTMSSLLETFRWKSFQGNRLHALPGGKGA